MKKLFLIIGIFVCSFSFGQTVISLDDNGGYKSSDTLSNGKLLTKYQAATAGQSDISNNNIYPNNFRKDCFSPSSKYVYGYNGTNPKILFIGDSRIAYLNYYFQTSLSNWKQCLGYVPFGDNGTSGGVFKIVVNGANYKGADFRNAKEFGISGSVTKITANDYIKFTTDSTSAGIPSADQRMYYDQIILYWLASPEMGSFRYSFNESGSWTTVDCATSSGDSLGYTVITQSWAGSLPYKRLRIEGVSDTCYMYGLSTEATFMKDALSLNDRLVIHNIARGGTSAYQWAQYPKYWQQFIEYIQPNQIHISHGSNDIGSSRTALQFITDIKTIVDSCQSADSITDIVVWSQFDQGEGTNYATTKSAHAILYEAQRTLLSSYSKLYDWSYFDLRGLLPDAKTIADLGIWSDGVHLNSTGNYWIAKRLRDIITNYSQSSGVASLNSTNYFMHSAMVSRSSNVIGSTPEINKIGFWEWNSSGGIQERGYFYAPNANYIYMNIAGTDYYQFRNTYWNTTVEYQPSYTADADATNNTLFRGENHSGVLCFKDGAGLVHEINPYHGTKTLTDATPTGIFELAFTTGQYIGGTINYTVKVTDGTDYQTHSGVVTFAAVNKGGTLTATITESATLESTAASSGTLTDAWTIVTGTNKVTITLDANTSLTPTAMSVEFVLIKNTTAQGTITQL